MIVSPLDASLPAFGAMDKAAVWRDYAELRVEQCAAAIITDAEMLRDQVGDDQCAYHFGDTAIVLKWLWSGGEQQAAVDVAVAVWRRVRAIQQARGWALWSARDCVDIVRMGLDGLGWSDADHRRFVGLFSASTGRGRR
ncbi:Uncharacterised protein [Mycobacteroides abscessus subsp. abscessus]|uniref:hypothetical protein n=1 Tax=Mycobacteroides abscessus TaxID=36809 RepID=UPI00092BBDAA|nr:hypothetical protein [Mycobacteroides abscessus]SIJ21113.1 Uncharacterised protein [Mycobacteroides abscessus subsp. abscessus]SLH39332.1 Uncharacterised protein [Mycobacteroides abscessus subsp. abscessus]